MSPKKKVLRVSLQKTVDSVIVHDMKNLAFRLSVLLQNMQENYENPMFKESIAEILNDTVRKMDDIVKKFRENDQQIVVKLRVDVTHILKKLLAELPQRRMKGVHLEESLENVPPIWGDPFYLHNAFHSLIENAMDAMPNGGTLKVHCGLTRVRKRAKILIEISDTGIGMTESFLQNELFHPFTTTKEKGLGLGLYTSQQIFALHGGKINVLSSPGSGTTFRITLPIEENGSQENSHH